MGNATNPRKDLRIGHKQIVMPKNWEIPESWHGLFQWDFFVGKAGWYMCEIDNKKILKKYGGEEREEF